MKFILLILIGLIIFGCSNQTKETKIDDIEPNLTMKTEVKTMNETTEKVATEPKIEDTRIAKTGDTVSVDYVGTLDNGTIFDQSKTPFKFKVGSGQVIKGFDDAATGMKINEEKNVHIPVEDAYGYPSEEQIITVALEKIDGGNVTIGQTIYANDAQGVVTKIENGQATIDFNHPLAGQALNFKIILRSIE